MSLLDDFARDCTLLDKTRQPDGEGGYTIAWTDGATFKNYFALDTSMQARAAEKQGVTSVYSGLVDKDVPIEYGDFYRDNSTGTTYRVTSDPEEKNAPESASADLRRLKFFTAERKDLPQ